MQKFLIYAMEGQMMCFMHAMLNAEQLIEAGHEVKFIFEGASCALIPELEESQNKLYLGLKEQGTIAGVCLACSRTLGVYEANEASGIPFLDDMRGHAGTAAYVNDGYEVLVF